LAFCLEIEFLSNYQGQGEGLFVNLVSDNFQRFFQMHIFSPKVNVMKIHFYLDRRKGKTERLPVFLQFWHKGQLLRAFTCEHCNLEDWDAEKERIKSSVNGASQINRLFQSMETEVFTLVRELKTVRKQVNIDYLKDNLTFLNAKERDFFSLWEEFIRIGFTEKKWGQGMVRRLDILKMHIKKINGKYKIGFNTINEKFYNAFLEYHYRQGFNASYASRNLELFRWFMNWASAEGYNHNMEYRKFKSPAVEKIKYEELFLTEAELIDLFRLDTDGTVMDPVKDMFCFSCFTGLRYADIMKLENANFDDDKLVIQRIKSSVKIEVPLTKIARTIADKYLPDSDGRVFPSISIQEFNRYLKELGRMAGINAPVMGRKARRRDNTGIPMQKWELLSSLFARRTFINLGVKKGIGLEIMCELTGNLADTIIHYYKTRNIHIETEIQKLNIL
jgi:integrase